VSRHRTRCALGIDVGSTETKAGIVSLDGRLLGLARSRHPTNLDPVAGRAEQDPEAWWTGMVTAVRAALGQAGAAEAGGGDLDVVGMSVDGHGPTFTPVDEAGRPVRPAMTWQDTRSGAEADALAAATGRTGWGLGVLPAARWLEIHEPAAAERARWYMNSWEALALRLTGRAATFVVGEATVPSREALGRAGLSTERFPPMGHAGEVLGPLLPDVADELGLPAATPVVGGVVDAYASLHGAGLLHAGEAIDVGGAAGGFGLYWDRPIEANGSFTAPAPLPGLWLVGGAMAATGAALDWFRDAVLAGRFSSADLLAEAAAVPAGAEGLLFLPYLAGERSPIWDPAARGAFAGLTLAHGRSAMTRSILEAAAFALRHVATPILEAGGQVDRMRVCGGPAHDPTWNQIKADVTGFRVEVPRILETAVVGSAILAATGVGAQPDLPAAIRAMATIDHVVEPDPANRDAYDAAFRRYVELHPAISRALTAPIRAGQEALA
jgi:xylulokinase